MAKETIIYRPTRGECGPLHSALYTRHDDAWQLHVAVASFG